MTNFLPYIQRFRTITLRYPSISSTNDLARQLFESGDIGHGTAIRADFQEEGRGQMGLKWSGNPGENIYMSLVLELNLPAEKQFLLNMAVCLAVLETIRIYLPEAMIKWPNDIYYKRQKLAGVLIENNLQGTKISSSILGIGLNVKQSDFGPLTKASSIALLSEKEAHPDDVYRQLLTRLETRLDQLQDEGEIWRTYHENLLFYQGFTTFEQNGRLFRAKVLGIDEWGRLKLEEDQKETCYGIKELRWVDL